MADLTVNNNVSAYAATATQTATENTTSKAESTESKDTQDNTEGVVYEKSTNKSNTLYNRDAIVARLKADQESRAASMQSLVEKLLGKQRDLFNSTGLAGTFRQAAALASPEDILKAQQDISEDGYWGVNQTSDRLVSMAIALSGGDTAKADEMMAAIEKGYEKATKAWGEELPKICQDTMAATRQKMEDWKNGVTTAEDYNKYLHA